MRIPIFKSRDVDNIRIYADEVAPGTWSFTRVDGTGTTFLRQLSGDEAAQELAAYRRSDSISFMKYYGGRPA
ncbi:hypothetical protein [Streptomyces sp. IBSNAI001]|uniref:hypothetical protein n=1 Tax=Streptomyces sp. IBSNAI001 TaxID=3457499 RepID=UPI003FCF10CE